MTKKFSLAVVVMSLFMISMQVSAQRTVRVDERVQTTYVNAYNVNVAQWLRIYPGDAFHTEIRNLSINGVSFVTNHGSMEIYAMGRLVARLGFGRIPSQATAHFPMGTRVSDISIRILGEVHVERVLATVIERHWRPVPPRPIPPRYPAPAPRPAPPRHPAPRPAPPRHEPAPRPTPPRHEPAPRPTPPRHEPAPRPTPPRHEPAPRPAPPRQGPGPGPRPGPRR